MLRDDDNSNEFYRLRWMPLVFELLNAIGI